MHSPAAINQDVQPPASHPRPSELLSTYISDPQSPRPDEVRRLVAEFEKRQLEMEVQVQALQEAQRRLETYRDRYVDLYDLAPLGYVTLDDEGYIQEINLAGAKLLGGDLAELVGYPFTDFVVAPDRTAFLEHIRKCCGKHQDVTCELGLMAKDGRLIPVQFHSVPVKPLGHEGTFCKAAITDISERKRTENAVQEERTLLRTLIDNLPDSIYVKDTQSRFVAANLATARIMGATTPADLLGKTDSDFYPEETAAEYLRDERELMRSGEPLVNKDEPHVGPKGNLTTISTTKVPIKDSRGTVVGLVGISRDITDRQRTQMELQRYRDRLEQLVQQRTEALQHAHDELRAVYDGMADGLLIADVETMRLVRANATICRMLGYSEGELLSLSVKDIHPASDWPAILRTFQAQAAAEIAVNENTPVLRKDGSVFYADIATNRIVYGLRPCLIGFFRDITDRRQAQEALRKSEDQYRGVVEACPDAVVMSDLEGTVLFASPQTWVLLGLSASEELIGKSVFDYVIEGDRRRLAANMSQVAEGEIRRGTEYTALRGDGTTVLAEASSVVIRDSQGQPKALMAVIRDITARKQAEAALKTAEELARSNRDLDQFASMISHDLQEPLRTVRGFVQLLQKKYANRLDAEADSFIEYAVDGTKRMETMIRDLLAYARAGTRSRVPLPIDAGAALRQALDNLRESIQEVGADVTHGELPAVHADRSQLAQLFQNLLGNALKFRGETSPKIHVDACREGDYWRFSVRDNGIGIDSKFHAQIFEVFQRPPTRKRYGGSGIGLAICKKIVERHGGRIWVESEPGRGATFLFTLPARVTQRSADGLPTT